MESLSFPQMDVRCETISRSHADTCEWIFSRPEYLDWRNQTLMTDHGGFFWIKSKPGAGKSTLMKFLLRTAHEHMKEDKVISFFFNARGEELERSLEGCYRGLLHQLLTQIPRLHVVLNQSKIPSGLLQGWPLNSLREMLSEAIFLLGGDRLTCFIDALDECPEDDIRDMIDFFEELGESATEKDIHLRICLSSRHYPQVSITRCQPMLLDQQDGHQQDIAKYLKSKLKVRRGKTADELRVAVQDKAHGIFMWVVLVVRILNKESDHGGNNTDLRKCLERIPGELHDLFRDILQRGIRDDQNLVPILQWISFARRPLTREEIYFAIRSGEPDFSPSSPWDPDEDSPDSMDLFILNASKGLAETTKGKAPKIQFIHESVRDYLRDTGFDILAPDLNVSLQGSAHDYIRHCCYRWISRGMMKALALPKVLPKVSRAQELRALRDVALKKFPLLEYSVNNVLHHAELAWCGGVPQESFVESFRWSPWVRIHALFAKYERDRYTAPADTLSYALVAHKAAMLLEEEMRLHADHLQSPQLDAALRMCLVNHDVNSFAKFLDIGISQHGFQVSGKTVETAIGMQDLTSLCAVFDRGLYTLGPTNSTPGLNEASQAGNAEVLQLLFERGAAIIDPSPIHHTCCAGQEHALRVLIAHGADVNAVFANGDSPLVAACKHGHAATAQTLIEYGACVNPRSMLRLAPLVEACVKGDEDLVQLLLQHGADPDFAGGHCNVVGGHEMTPLHRACLDGHEGIVRMLLEHGANVNSYENTGLLVSVSAKGFNDILQTLFLHGLDPNVLNGTDYLRAITIASCNGNQKVVKTLINNGTGVQLQPPIGYGYAVLSVTKRCRSRILELLLDNSEGFRVQDRAMYRSSLRRAIRIGSSKIVKILRERGVTLPEDAGT